MEERSLRITGTDKNFLNRLSDTISKILIPTKVGINGMLISVKRNNLLKVFEQYSQKDLEVDKKSELEKRYEEAYTAYLEALDKYVMDSIYKKVKNNTATEFEKEALSKYYGVISLKENEYVEYKYRKQKYLLELDRDSVITSGKDKIIEKYNKFYISKMDWLYKGILKNYSIKLADTINIYDSSKEWIYTKIFYTLEEYLGTVLRLKFQVDGNEKYKEILSDYEKYESFSVGKLDIRDGIEKNMLLLGISRKLFTHSLPLVVAEQCYMKLLKDARSLVQDTTIAIKREKAYVILISLIEDYNIKLLSTKVYWDNSQAREQFKNFWDKYKTIEKIKDKDYVEYMRKKEILFIRDDMKKARLEKQDYTKLIRYYKRKLVDFKDMKEIQGFVSNKNYKGKKDIMQKIGA